MVNELKLKITDYSSMPIKEDVKNMYAILFDYTRKQDCKIWLQTRKEVL